MELLKRRSDFQAAAAGARAPASAFVLQARRRTDAGGPRVGLTVSRQVGNAVERNRVRRRLRELMRLAAARAAGGAAAGATGRLHAGHDYVLIGQRAALAVPFAEMMRELDAALGRIHAPERRGTGGDGRAPLHEAGSPGRPRPPRRRTRSYEPTEDPPQER